MWTNLTGCQWVVGVRATLTTVATALTVFGLTLVLRRVDAVVPQARDAVLVLLGVALVLTAGAVDAKGSQELQESQDQPPHTVPAERTRWHEYDGSFRGMIG